MKRSLDKSHPDNRPTASKLVEILTKLINKQSVKKNLKDPSTSTKKQQSEQPSTSKLPKQTPENDTTTQRHNSKLKLENKKPGKKDLEKVMTSRSFEENVQKGPIDMRNKNVLWTKDPGSKKWFPKKGELDT